ncbi:hypothetical protein DBV05_g2179 [Lasiodiplodia theobromae]|uniref:F-box domain-containing protein n=1 Tax=Lasiodiplodia theobromae TaxID=45133 RepID=A0A5N5DQR0_9PEZI|nr:hypothetical protein DBV05_g2179 [Lasiodiplodia theobromae]
MAEQSRGPDKPKIHPLRMLLLRKTEQSRDLEESSGFAQSDDLKQSSYPQQWDGPEQSRDTDKPKRHPLRMQLFREYLTKLPDELLVMIASNLNAFESKQLRLTSKTCCRAATPRVFQEIKLRMQKDSIKNFLSIAFDDKLCQHPKTIIFEFGETRRVFTHHTSFETSLYQRPCKSFKRTFMESAADMMLNAMPRLTNLDNFVMSDDILRSSMFTWRRLWLTSNKWSLHRFMRGDVACQLSGILSVLSLNKHLKRLSMRTCGRAFWIDKYHRISQAFPEVLGIANEERERLTTEAPIQLMSSAFRHLSSLHLQMTVGATHYPLITRGVGDLLCNLQNLKVLSVFFETRFPITNYDLFLNGQKCLVERLSEGNLPHLEYISLRNVATSEAHLLSFFSKVSSTLKVLNMKCIQILPGRGSWASALPELRNLFKALEKVDIATLMDGEIRHFIAASWHFVTSTDMIVTVAHRRAEALSLEQPQHKKFLRDAYSHYEADMEHFLLRSAPHDPTLQIRQVVYMTEHPNFCEWCRECSDRWRDKKTSMRDEQNMLNRSLGIREDIKALRDIEDSVLDDSDGDE